MDLAYIHIPAGVDSLRQLQGLSWYWLAAYTGGTVRSTRLGILLLKRET
jgi:hypothetical protein